MAVSEVLLILGVALIVFKPEDLPGLLINLAKILRKIRQFVATVMKSLESALEQAELQEYVEKSYQQAKPEDESQQKKS